MKRMGKQRLAKFVPIELQARADAARARQTMQPPERVTPRMRTDPLEFREDVIGEHLRAEAEGAIRNVLEAVREGRSADAGRYVVQLDTIMDLYESLFGLEDPPNAPAAGGRP